MKRVEKVEYHPELVDIDIFDLSEKGFITNKDDQYTLLDEIKPSEIKYIPLLFYDDLLECMLYNLKKIDDGAENILDPSFLLDQKIIILQESEKLDDIKTQDYSWFNSFDKINLEPIIESIRTTMANFLKTKQELQSGVNTQIP